MDDKKNKSIYIGEQQVAKEKSMLLGGAIVHLECRCMT